MKHENNFFEPSVEQLDKEREGQESKIPIQNEESESKVREDALHASQVANHTIVIDMEKNKDFHSLCLRSWYCVTIPVQVVWKDDILVLLPLLFLFISWEGSKYTFDRSRYSGSFYFNFAFLPDSNAFIHVCLCVIVLFERRRYLLTRLKEYEMQVCISWIVHPTWQMQNNRIPGEF